VVTNKEAVNKLGSTLPPTKDWLDTLSGAPVTWLRALLRSTNIVHNSGYQANSLKCLFAPRANQQVTITYAAGVPASVTVAGTARSLGVHKPAFEAVSVKFNAAARLMSPSLRTGLMCLCLLPSPSSIDLSKALLLFMRLWGSQQVDQRILLEAVVRYLASTFAIHSLDLIIDAAAVERFCLVIGNQGESKRARSAEVEAPMDLAIVTGWQVRLFRHSLCPCISH
jgi:hypothetical protein